jgi:hypothetical protein
MPLTRGYHVDGIPQPLVDKHVHVPGPVLSRQKRGHPGLRLPSSTRYGRRGGTTEGNLEDAEAGLPEDGVDPTETEAGASLEAEEDVAPASEANKPLYKIAMYIFFKEKTL